MKKLSFATKMAILPLAVLSLQSQISYADGVALTEEGLELTVTANRRVQKSNETLSAVTVISRTEIEKTQAASVEEVLTRVPGISISNSGGLGKASSVFIRGTNSKHVLVLVDGVRHGSATLGLTAFNHLPIDQIERIEIVRGPRSSVYGADAIGGVIQIFTRKGKKGFTPSVTLSAGSNSTFKGAVNLSGGNEKTNFNLNVKSLTTDGIDACNSTTAGCFADEPDKDGYENDSVSLNLSHTFTDSLEGQLTVLHSEGESQFDGGFQNESEFVQQVINAQLSKDFSNKLNIKFAVGQSRDESDNFKDGAYSGTFNTKRETASLVGEFKVNDHNGFLFGADYYDAMVFKNGTDYVLTSRNNKGVFTNYTGKFNKTSINLALRNDDNEQYGSKTTGGIAFGYDVDDSLVARVSYGTAFHAPTFNQLYWPGFGNSDLLPEESKNLEIGLDGILENGTWGFNMFQNDIDNLIAGFPSSNIDEARIRGVEGLYSRKIGNYDFSTNFTLQKPKALSGTNAGKILRVRPERMLNVDLDRKFGRFSIGTSLHAESERYVDAANTESLGGFARLDLRANYDVSKNWSVGLKVENVLNKDYSLNKGYNQDGINGMLTVKFSPK